MYLKEWGLVFLRPPRLRVAFFFLFCVVSLKQNKLRKQNAAPVWWPMLEVASRVDREGIAIFGRDVSVQNFSGVALLDFQGAAADPATFCWSASGRRSARCACAWLAKH